MFPLGASCDARATMPTVAPATTTRPTAVQSHQLRTSDEDEEDRDEDDNQEDDDGGGTAPKGDLATFSRARALDGRTREKGTTNRNLGPKNPNVHTPPPPPPPWRGTRPISPPSQ